MLFYYFFAFDQQLAAVEGVAFDVGISAVIQVVFTGCFADGNLRHVGLVMGTTLALALLGNSTLRMCHFTCFYSRTQLGARFLVKLFGVFVPIL